MLPPERSANQRMQPVVNFPPQQPARGAQQPYQHPPPPSAGGGGWSQQQQQPPPPQQQQPPQQATWQQEHLLAQRACRSCGSLPSEFEGMASQCSVGMHGADVSSGAPDQPSTLGIPDESLVLRSIPGTVAAA